ncbi:hypothetical protein CHU98_g2159 [Xylaria longipes]|nr:hypothetical protein CHU98_g2159 [Xylaria longipes]
MCMKLGLSMTKSSPVVILAQLDWAGNGARHDHARTSIKIEVHIPKNERSTDQSVIRFDSALDRVARRLTSTSSAADRARRRRRRKEEESGKWRVESESLQTGGLKVKEKLR